MSTCWSSVWRQCVVNESLCRLESSWQGERLSVSHILLWFDSGLLFLHNPHQRCVLLQDTSPLTLIYHTVKISWFIVSPVAVTSAILLQHSLFRVSFHCKSQDQRKSLWEDTSPIISVLISSWKSARPPGHPTWSQSSVRGDEKRRKANLGSDLWRS